MAKKKASHSAKRNTPAPAPVKKPNTKFMLVAIGIVTLVVIAVWAGSGTGEKKRGLAGGAPPEEQKYIGRLLPAGYQEPKIADIQAYTTTVKMTNITGTQSDAGISIPADEVVANKIVLFEYKKAGGDPIPLLAYVKPSGKLFVGVSFCPPCEGRGQRIEAGGTLVCESCGTARTLETGVGISGACKLYPIDELPATLTNGTITVDKAVIESWTPQPLDRKVGA